MSRISPKHDGLAVALLLIVYVITACIVSPAGEFPRGDDFDYAETAWHLSDTGQMTFSDWPAMTLITHVLWGAVWTSVGGKSYFVLRLSMIAMSWLGAIGLYLWSKNCGNSLAVAFLIALAWAINPIVFDQSYTFQTDLTGATLMIWLTLALIRHNPEKPPHLLFVSLLAGIVWLARQTAVLTFLVYGLICTVHWLRRKLLLLKLVLLGLPFGLIVIGFYYWRDSLHVMPFMASLPGLRVPTDFISLANRAFSICLALGIGLAPCFILILFRRRTTDAENSRTNTQESPAVSATSLLWGTIVAYTIFLLLAFQSYDRYLLPLLGLGLMVISLSIGRKEVRKSGLFLGAVGVVLLSIWSVMQLQNEMQKQRVFWQFVNDLHERGIDPENVNAGVQYAGVYRFSPRYRGTENAGPYLIVISEIQRQNHIALFSPLSETTSDRRYTLAEQQPESLRVIESRAWEGWFGSGEIYFMEDPQIVPDKPE